MVDIDKIEYIQSKINDETILKNKKILSILEEEFYMDCIVLFRHKLETLYRNYCYEYADISNFLNLDLDGNSWEHFFDIIYENIEKNYNYDILFEKPEYYFKLLTQENS